MTLQIDSDELLTILENCKSTVDALIPVALAAGTGDFLETLTAFPRAIEIVHQSAKSTHAIVVQVRERNELLTS